MEMAMTVPFSLRNKLKTLCAYGDGWSYAIFWRFLEKNPPMLLNVEEAYYEEQLGEGIQNMIPQVHLLGEGIVGEAAFTNKHNWLHSVSCEVDSGLYQQFSSGIIKTIVVIPVKACGVVQFGSRNTILETNDFLDQTRSLLKEIDDIGMIGDSENDVFPLDFTNDDLDGLLASISSENSCDWNLKYLHDENRNDPRQVFSSCEERITSPEFDSSSLSDQLKCTIKAFLEPNSSMDNLISQNTPLFDENLCFDSLEQLFASETIAQEVCTSFASSIVHDSSLTSLQNSMDNVVTEVDLPASSITLNGISSSLEPIDMSAEILKFSSMDDLCQCFAPSQEATSSCRTMIQLNNNVSERIKFIPTCSDLGLPEKETSVIIHSSENDFLDNMEFNLGCDQGSEWWLNLLTPLVSAAADNTGFSECISELNTSTPTDNTRKRLFSELGIEELLRDETNYINPFNSSSFENELSSSNKKHMVEFSPMNITSLHFGNLAGAETRANLIHSGSELDKSNSVLTMKDTFPKLQVGVLVNDQNSINIESAVPVHPRRSEEPTKPTKKKAKPGETTRPRPKDRQQIQDCIKELSALEEEKLRWGDMFFIKTLPFHRRHPHLIPLIPQPYRDNLESYYLELKKLNDKIIEFMSKALKINPNELLELFEEGRQAVKMGYYPPCPQPEKVIGLNPHSDGSAITILLQVNEIQGLQIKIDGMWIPINPLSNAFVVNVGDALEIITNGIYRSIEHRVMVNSEKERMSIATFHNIRKGGNVGPISSLVTPERPTLFKTITAEDFLSGYLSSKIKGKSFLDVVRIQKEILE